jgi:hypothetical protein
MWISSTVPGTYDANNWGSNPGAQIAIALFILGFVGQVIGFFTCATLLIVGGARLRRYPGDDRSDRIKEIACNAVGMVIPSVSSSSAPLCFRRHRRDGRD